MQTYLIPKHFCPHQDFKSNSLFFLFVHFVYTHVKTLSDTRPGARGTSSTFYLRVTDGCDTAVDVVIARHLWHSHRHVVLFCMKPPAEKVSGCKYFPFPTSFAGGLSKVTLWFAMPLCIPGPRRLTSVLQDSQVSSGYSIILTSIETLMSSRYSPQRRVLFIR